MREKNSIRFFRFIDKVPLSLCIVLALTLGLAPFAPPHVVEKLGMLFSGKLVRPIDWFDLFLHGFPWILLAIKIASYKTLRKED